ncbi:MAG: translocation/assembly module TamB domain-containing protein [Bacteroidales bacterium]|nr:translocation/assembly module TamB domain-containing protein [Bacteroidales bacterium]
MKKTGKIVIRTLCCIAIAVYFVVALCFCDMVQNIAGSIAGNYFSKEWGGKVGIARLRINPLGGVDLYGIQLVHPNGDTIFRCGKLGVGFVGNPIDAEGLDVKRVSINNAYFHLVTDESGKTNLQFIIDYFHSDEPSSPHKRFIVRCKKLYLNGVEYRMDLNNGKQHPIPEHGVSYQHQHYYNVQAYIKDIRVNESWVDCRIVRFSTREQSGFHLADLSCDAKVSPFGIKATNMELSTDSTHLLLDASLSYEGWENMDPYCDNVRHTLLLRPGSVVDMKDVAYWVPLLWGVNDKVYLEGQAEGSVADLKVDDFDIKIGDMLALHFAGSVKGLPDIATTRFDIDVSNLQTSYLDATRINLPDIAKVEIPLILKPLQAIQGQVSLHGTTSQCTSNIALLTGIGPLTADVNVQTNDRGEHQATANIVSSGLKIGSLLPNEWVSQTGLRAKVEMHGADYSKMTGHANGELYSTVIRGVPIHTTSFKAALLDDKIDLNLDLDDELLQMTLSASMTRDKEMPQYFADATINHYSLSRLHFVKTEKPVSISSHIRLDATGNEIEQMTGNLSLSNTVLNIGDEQTSLNNIILSIYKSENGKNLSLSSDWLTMNAKWSATYAQIPKILQSFCAHYCPAYFSPWHTIDDKELANVSLNADARWKGDFRQLETFGIGVGIARNAKMSISYNAKDNMRLVVRSDSIAIGSLCLRNMGVIGNRHGDRYNMMIESEQLCVGGPAFLEDVHCLVDAASRLSEIRISSGEHGNMKNIDLRLLLQSDTTANIIRLSQGDFDVGGSKWHMVCDNDIRIDHSGVNVPLIVASDSQQSISASVSIEHEVDDFVQMMFNNVSLAWMSRQWLAGSGYNIDGRIDGTATLRGFASTPYVTANLGVEECQVNDYQLGRLSLLSEWNAEENQVKLTVGTRTFRESGSFSPLTANGTIDMADKDPKLAIDCDFDHFPLEMAMPLISSFASRFEGELLGHIHLGGTMRQPRIKGDAVVKDGLLAISATGVAYRFADTLHLDNHQVQLDNFIVRDPQNNTLSISGTVLYEKTNNIGMDLTVDSRNFMLYNVSERLDAPSGQVLTSLSGKVKGNAERMDVNISARTNRGSRLVVPVDDRKQVEESNFITFVDPHGRKSKTTKSADSRNTQIPLYLTIELEITPDLRLRLPMTFQQIAPNLSATGAGNVLITLAGSTQPHITGSYELSSGNLSLELFSFLATNFTIDPGSTIVLPGDINNTRFDIKASHLVHANLASLMGTTVESSGRTVNVEDVIVLSGTLNEPHVSFDLRFPNADKSVEEEVSVYIDRSNEREVLTQAISLLLTGQFVNASSNSSVMDNAASGGLNIMTSTLGNMVSNVVKVVDVNFGYQGETALTTEQFDVDIRKEWDRLYFETTLGYGGDSRALSTDNATTTNLVGDVLVGYKIKPRLHLFVFNRTNTNDFTRTELPYKQGVGLKLTRDFNNWGDIFYKKK